MNKKLKQLLIALIVLSTYVYAESTVVPKNLWITPSDSICKSNGGKIDNGVCIAPWQEAKKICSASGGKLPSREDLQKMVSSCGGINVSIDDSNWNLISDKNTENKSYRSCYKSKGFAARHYWSSTAYAHNTAYAWNVLFYTGHTDYGDKTYTYHVRCVH